MMMMMMMIIKHFRLIIWFSKKEHASYTAVEDILTCENSQPCALVADSTRVASDARVPASIAQIHVLQRQYLRRVLRTIAMLQRDKHTQNWCRYSFNSY